MIHAAFLLLAARPLPLAPLFGQPQPAVERALGKGQPAPTDRRAGMAVQNVRYGAVAVEYVNGRARAMTRTFPNAPALDWKSALSLSGFSPSGVAPVAVPNVENGWLLREGALPKGYQAVFSNRKDAPSLQIEAPYALVLEPKGAVRKAVLDGLRPTVEKTFHGQKVKFVVNLIAATDDWAFVDASPLSTSGASLDLKDSALAGNAGSDSVYALLRRGDAGWTPVATSVFPQDLAWLPWAERYQAPSAIFPNYERPTA